MPTSEFNMVFPPEAGTTGRGLMQRGDKLFVVSECCEALINGDEYEGVYSVYCGLCTSFLSKNPLRWSQTIHGVKSVNLESAEVWGQWGEFWFGIKGFGMEVEE